jgi:ubiquinone/menaquinone biosynthesis C-methylase UbiE
MNRQALFQAYWKFQSLIVPGLKYSQALYEDVLSDESRSPRAWLDLGCGHNLLPSWRSEQEVALVGRQKLVVGIDYDLPSLVKHKTIKCKARGDITRLPFADDTFDLVTANMVFEHLQQPESQLREIARVLKSGGRLIFHTPNVLGYGTLAARVIPEAVKAKLIFFLQGRKEEDVFPAYYRMNSPSRIEKLAGSSGLDISSIRMICSSAQLVVCPPLVIVELLWIKMLLTRAMRPFRTNIIAILQKP